MAHPPDPRARLGLRCLGTEAGNKERRLSLSRKGGYDAMAFADLPVPRTVQEILRDHKRGLLKDGMPGEQRPRAVGKGSTATQQEGRHVVRLSLMRSAARSGAGP
jgi:hypothetical protein